MLAFIDEALRQTDEKRRLVMIDTSHCQIAVTESRPDGQPILFIHGNSSCKEVFRHQIDVSGFGDRYRCIAMDLPGHGASEDAIDPLKTYCMPGYADCALELLSILKAESAVVVGWSLGGHIAIEMVSKSARIPAYSISGTPPVAKGEDALAAGFLPSEHMHLAGQRDFSDEEADVYAHATCGINAPYEAFLLNAVKRTEGQARKNMFAAFVAGLGCDQQQLVQTNKTPLAIINGADEPFVNNDFVKSLAYANLWENKIHLLNNIGHAPFWEMPDQYNPILKRFLDNVV
jgi:pimeloyl-ACP methyl ester carboxylesterase